MVAFAAALVLGIAIYYGVRLSRWWLALPGAIFVALVFSHEPIRRAGERARRAVDFYAKGLARLEGRWAGQGEKGLDYLDLEHPYAADLDLFGEGSLFELLCTARTRAGEETLAAWLLDPAAPETIRDRQRAVAELRPLLDLREDLELLGVEVRGGIDPSALASWGHRKREFPGKTVLAVASILGSTRNRRSLGLAVPGHWASPNPCRIATRLCVCAFSRRTGSRTVLSAVDQRTHDLVLLSELLHRLERETFESPLLKQLVKSLETDGLPASAQIRRLARLLSLLDYQRNQLFIPIAVIWLWKIQIALRIDAWRAGSGRKIAHWLSAIGEFEALCRPGMLSRRKTRPTHFPISSPGQSASRPTRSATHCFRAMRVSAMMSSLGAVTRVLIVSGSNMSGKSTLLRTVGVNAILALAGAPVPRFSTDHHAPGRRCHSPHPGFAPGRPLAVLRGDHPSASDRRPRAGPLPLLFLFDELFNGTNSHDRCVGAESVVRGLIDLGSIGLVTTHDLTLAQIADTLAPQVENVHFEDRLEDGKMLFDYRMRPGVVTHSNALALMRAIGLEV